MHAQHNRRDPDLFGGDLMGRFNAVEIWHGDVQHRDVGPRGLRQVHRTAAVAGLAHNLKVLLLFENEPESAPNYCVVVGKNNSDQTTLSSSALHWPLSSRK